MHDLFCVIVYKTSEPNKFAADEQIKCIADRKSVFEHGIWGEMKPL